MSITTKTGDTGETSLVGGKRVSKASLRVDTYGDIDELSSYLGLVAASEDKNPEFVEEIQNIQRALFLLAADFATPNTTVYRISSTQVENLEKLTQKLVDTLPPMCCFVLPGGCQVAALLQVARTVCRRAERKAVALQQQESINSQGLIYLNRLSDYLFMAARYANKQHGIEEPRV